MKPILTIFVFITTISLFGQNGIHIESGNLFYNDAIITIEDGSLNNQSNSNINGTINLKSSSGNSINITAFNNSQLFENIVLSGLGEVRLQSNIQINQLLSLTNSGTLNLTDFNLTLDSNGEIVGENNDNKIIGNAGSTISIQKNHSSGITPDNFGNIGVEILSSDVPLGTTTITRKYGQLTIDGLESINRYYEISPTNNTNLNAHVKFYYTDVDFDNSEDMNLASLLSSVDGVTNWLFQGGIYNSGNPHSHELSNISNFSTWVIVINGIVLNNQDYNSQGNLTIYPNPTQNILNISYSNKNSYSKYTIFDMTGRIVLSKSDLINNNSTIETSMLSSGTYLLEINDNDSPKLTTLFIKN